MEVTQAILDALSWRERHALADALVEIDRGLEDIVHAERHALTRSVGDLSVDTVRVHLTDGWTIEVESKTLDDWHECTHRAWQERHPRGGIAS